MSCECFGATSRRCIMKGARSVSSMRTATTESITLCVLTKELTAFIELEAAVRNHQITEKQERDSPFMMFFEPACSANATWSGPVHEIIAA